MSLEHENGAIIIFGGNCVLLFWKPGFFTHDAYYANEEELW